MIQGNFSFLIVIKFHSFVFIVFQTLNSMPLQKSILKTVISCLIIWSLLLRSALAQSQGPTNFDNNWRFHLGGALGAEAPDFNDVSWRKVDLPHDWSIEDRPGTHSPFDPTAIDQVGGGFTTGGTGWYRKTFLVPQINVGQKIIIQFDGVYMNADVYVNGQHIGNHPYGYTSFWYDITKSIKFGQKNIIAVEVKNEGQNSRWYSGSGIYRHVWLKTVNPVHVAQWGTYITTPAISEASAMVSVKTQVVNEGTTDASINVVTKLINPQGMEAGRINSKLTLTAGDKKELQEQTPIHKPQLWSCASPNLYRAITEIYQDGVLINTVTNNFGIRTIKFDVVNGFQLNGQSLKLKGGCFHNDNGPLGSKAYDRAEERKVELLKASGFNAIRCSHNPPSPVFLAACDSLGMLVIDEAFDAWNYGKNPYDYHLYFNDWWQRDLESMVSRDENHPSIILWSIGNEIIAKEDPVVIANAKKLAAYVRNLDPTRPVTSAVDNVHPDKDPYFAALDVAGYNYAISGDYNGYVIDHQRMPQRIMLGTESFPLEAFNNWMAVEDNAYVTGDFVWTAWDYIGEASLGWLGYPQDASYYPWNLAFCGDIDICGWKRPQSYYRDVLWKANQLSVFVKPPVPSFQAGLHTASWSKWNWVDVVPEWNWKGYENKPLEVSVYSSCDSVELFLNNRSLGRKATNRSTKFIAAYNVPYEPGQLKAIGFSNHKVVNTSILQTAAKPTHIKLTADRTLLKANNEDLSYVTVELVDSKGNRNPLSEDLLNFDVKGPGTIAGVGNANPVSTESFQVQKRKAWKGRCLVIIKSGNQPGKIVLKVHTKELPAQQFIIKTI